MLLRIIYFITLVFTSFAGFAQENTKPGYDAALAKKLGADAYGMKQYVMVILVTGKAAIEDKALKDSLFAGHMKNIGRLAKEGKLVVAGPYGKNDLNYRGVFVFNTASVEETKAMVGTDPAVLAGIFDAIYIPWYCTAGLVEVNGIHEKVQKTSF
ncbi:MAG: hypothetical protein H7Y86_16240 [Rhizobacter sp.]|nr:hypothetical protein [Ferruginibacter sp.]